MGMLLLYVVSPFISHILSRRGLLARGLNTRGSTNNRPAIFNQTRYSIHKEKSLNIRIYATHKL